MSKIKFAYCIVCFLIIGAIVGLLIKGKEEEEVYEEVYSEAVIETTEEEPVLSEEVKPEIIPSLTIDTDAMIAINSDYRFWLNLPDTEISYPVVLAKDNDYYLHRDFTTKSYAYAGTLFLDAYSKNGVDQKNLIIYGHNMKNGSMFGQLKKFRNSEYFDAHPYLEIYGIEETRIYEIFSIREVSSDITTLNYALDDFSVSDYIESAKEESECFREVEYEEDAQIVTLSTCVNNSARRLLLSAIQIQ